jgi:flagellar hook-associated protein 2
MATISSPGLGSGLDVKSIVSQLVELEKRPLTTIQLRTTAAQTRLSGVGQIKGQLAALDDALRNLTQGCTYGAKTVSSSATSLSGIASVPAALGSYEVQVTQLARGQSAQSTAFAPNATVGSGTLTLEMGQWQAGPMFVTGGSSVSITVAATDTLADIASKINDATTAVRASVINDGSGQRLVIRATGTGKEQGFRIQVSDSDGNNTDNLGLSRLGYDPQAGAFGLTLAQAAQDTLATVDGIAVSSSNRTLVDVIPGVTLTVNEVTTQPVTVDVKRDDKSVQTAIQAFVDAYNKLNSTLNEALRYDPQTGQAGALQGDSTMVTLQSALRRLVGTVGPGPVNLQRWSDVGVEMARDGSLSINNSKLNAALAQPDTLKTLLSNAGDGGVVGLAKQLRDFTSGALSTGGRMALKTKAIEGELQRLNEQASKVNEKARRTEARLLAQYSRLDAALSQMNALNQYVSQQVAQWNKSTK